MPAAYEPTTVQEQIKALTEAKHRLAVWEAVFQYLDDFISKDGRATQKAIRVPDCLVEIVPEDLVDEVLQTIADSHIKQFKQQIFDIEQRKLAIPIPPKPSRRKAKLKTAPAKEKPSEPKEAEDHQGQA